MLHLQFLSLILVASHVNQAEKCCYKSSNTLPDASTEGEAVIQAKCAAVCIDEVRLPCTLGLSVIYGLLNTQHLRAHYSYIYIIE